jgi:hypothetical protein
VEAATREPSNTERDENYDSSELRKIFEKIVKDNGWTFKFDRDAVKDEWFKSRQQYFKYFGRDIEVFFIPEVGISGCASKSIFRE